MNFWKTLFSYQYIYKFCRHYLSFFYNVIIIFHILFVHIFFLFSQHLYNIVAQEITIMNLTNHLQRSNTEIQHNTLALINALFLRTPDDGSRIMGRRVRISFISFSIIQPLIDPQPSPWLITFWPMKVKLEINWSCISNFYLQYLIILSQVFSDVSYIFLTIEMFFIFELVTVIKKACKWSKNIIFFLWS